MSKPIQTRIVEIDNSLGIHIPKSWLEQIGISGAVEIEVQGDRIVIRAARNRVPAGRKRSQKWQSNMMMSCLMMSPLPSGRSLSGNGSQTF